jgi:hypothetical protein
MGAYGSLLLKKQFKMSASSVEIENRLAQYPQDEFAVKKVSQNEYKFISNTSIGTMVLRSGGSVEGIKIYALFESQDHNLVNVTLKTKVRVELILTSGIILLFAINFYMINNEQSHSNWIIIFLPVILIWLWLVYRFQEQMLALKVERYLLSLSQAL